MFHADTEGVQENEMNLTSGADLTAAMETQ